MDKDFFVQNVKMLCAEKGIKPTNACKESGVGGSFLSDISRGQTPSVAKVQLLAQYLNVTTSELLGETENILIPEDKETTAAKDGGLLEEFGRIFDTLTPENQNVIIAEMLKRLREQ